MMSNYYIYQYANLTTLFAGVLSGLIRFRRFDLGARLYWLLILVILFTELIAYLVAVRYKNNLEVYAISAIAQTVISCLYFDCRILYFKRRFVGRSLALLSIVVGVLNFYILQPAQAMNFNFLIWQAVLVFFMCSISIVGTLRSKWLRWKPQQRIHFWLTFILAFFWPITLLQWIFYFQLVKYPILQNYVDVSLFIVNIVGNAAIAVLLFSYPATARRYGL